MRLGADIAAKLLDVAVGAIRLAERLPRDRAARHVALQLVRCATSGGANYEEARAAESRDDFVHKVGVAAKEMRETVFWLAVVRRSGWARPDLDALLEQVRELAAILAACKRTARRSAG
jgi:four helix bundle protein